MNLLMYIDFVAPIILSRRLNIPVEEAKEILLESLTDEALNELTDDEKEYLGIMGTNQKRRLKQ